MKKETAKFILSVAVICAVVAALLVPLNGILLAKSGNRYFMLEKWLEQQDEDYDVQVYGSCHSYTSFDAVHFEQTYGLSAFVLGNPSEIIPVTYLRMAERFKTDAPKVAVVETWGLNAYETYISQSSIFESYMPVNVERLPLSAAKLELIRDFPSLNVVDENLSLIVYKDRIMDGSITEMDFHYATDQLFGLDEGYANGEMSIRFANNGYKRLEPDPDGKSWLADYNERQAVVADDEMLEVEADIVKYVDKIIELCEQYDVQLIFYRAPYISTENELRKANWFADYCGQRDLTFIDTEKELVFDPVNDFEDEYHLNENGAFKLTEYLAPLVVAAANA